MSEITLHLPDDVMRSAELWASHAGRPVADLLAETIKLSLQPLGPPPGEGRPLSEWSDSEVLAAADEMMAPDDDERLSELLDRQQAATITGAERSELTALMQLYQVGQLRKARALSEAVRRGLREPLQP
jgi:hypothetical protein